jgi:membrane protein DedA with SNARE-associated domain
VEYNYDVPDIGHILENHLIWAYIVLLAWTFLEGETIVIFAGVAARDGHLWLPMIILCAFCGSLCSDQFVFFLGRLKGKAFVANRPKLQVRAEKVYRLLERHQTWLILGFRFLYGLRNITPFAIGMSEVPTRRFIVLNVIGAAVWAATFACGGYLFGAAMETVLAGQKKWFAILGLAVIAAIVWVVRMIRRRYISKRMCLNQVEKKDA